MKVVAQIHCGESKQVFTSASSSLHARALWAGKSDEGGFVAQARLEKLAHSENPSSGATPSFALRETAALSLPSPSKAIAVNKKMGLLAAGCFDGTLSLVDELEMKSTSSTKDAEMVHCLDFATSTILSGGQKGVIAVWDPRLLKKPGLRIVPETSLPPECWCLLSAGEHFIIGGYSDGYIRSFDIRNSGKLLSQTKLNSGVCALGCHDGINLAAATQAGTISLSTISSSGTSWAIKYLDQKHVISSGSAGDLKVWELSAGTRPPMPHLSAFPSQQSLLSIDILSSDKPSLSLSCSLDNTVRVISLRI